MNKSANLFYRRKVEVAPVFSSANTVLFPELCSPIIKKADTFSYADIVKTKDLEIIAEKPIVIEKDELLEYKKSANRELSKMFDSWEKNKEMYISIYGEESYDEIFGVFNYDTLWDSDDEDDDEESDDSADEY